VNERLAATHGVTIEIRTGINTGEAALCRAALELADTLVGVQRLVAA
jgi:hypothetical protein